MQNKSVNVSILCDHVIAGKLLKQYLSGQPGINVLLQVSTLTDLLRKQVAVATDVLLVGMMCPDSMEPGTLLQVREKFPGSKLIVLSVSMDPKFISSLMECEIYGYISPADQPDTIVKAVLLAAQNKLYPTRLFTQAMYLNKQHSIKTSSLMRNTRLTERDKKILQLLWEEKSNKQIAEELFLSIRSVEKLRQNIKRKLGAKSTIGMIKHIIN